MDGELNERGEEPVDSKTAWRSACFTDYPGFQSNPSPSDRVSREATSRFNRGVSLTVTLLISLALWASIWAAVASLAAPQLL